MCDRYVFFRTMARHYAAEEGLLATFMPKPFADKTGNGAHFNMSLRDLATGANAFACDPAADPAGPGPDPARRTRSSRGSSATAGRSARRSPRP